VRVGSAVEVGAAEPVPLAERSALGRKLAEGSFVVTAEVSPPRGWNPEPLLARSRELREAGVDAVNVLDSARAQSRMGVIPAALLVEREVEVETVIHYTCRDRNMLGMISDLLGAAAGGLRNVLIVTGDPPAMGPYRDATAVFDIDSIGLVNVVHGLNRGVDPGGNRIDAPTRWVVGVAVNAGAADLEREVERFYWKVDAGADFAVTQPIFDPGDLERFLARVRDRIEPVPILAGLWPLTSLRNAEFLANEVPGVRVPRTVIERMREAEEGGAARARAEGVAIAREAFEGVRPLVRGVHLSVPGGRLRSAVELLDAVRERAGAGAGPRT
ncbi:MAG TPA: methylenetetrahydrofolate reductase, partial [Longimicrobiales bacterium]|nr:methylenetetrahydrofolate reductase [Longimicrobiales bacterium]